jgi:hypothetical protein
MSCLFARGAVGDIIYVLLVAIILWSRASTYAIYPFWVEERLIHVG